MSLAGTTTEEDSVAANRAGKRILVEPRGTYFNYRTVRDGDLSEINVYGVRVQLGCACGKALLCTAEQTEMMGVVRHAITDPHCFKEMESTRREETLIVHTDGQEPVKIERQFACTAEQDMEKGIKKTAVSLQYKLPPETVDEHERTGLADEGFPLTSVVHSTIFRSLHMDTLLSNIVGDVRDGLESVSDDFQCLFVDWRTGKAVLVFSSSYTTFEASILEWFCCRNSAMWSFMRLLAPTSSSPILSDPEVINWEGNTCGIIYSSNYLFSGVDQQFKLCNDEDEIDGSQWNLIHPVQKMLAFAMGSHARLGQKSPLYWLDPYLLRLICISLTYSNHEVGARIKEAAAAAVLA